ncbi:MAG: SH3 domain-containing protein [Thermovirgaceae bacterium]
MNRIMTAAMLCAILFLSAGAAFAQPDTVISDIKRFPQNPFHYLPARPDDPLIDSATAAAEARAFRERFFAPWSRSRPVHDKEAVMWAWKSFTPEDPYLVGGNLRPPGEAWFAAMREQARMDAYGSLNERAITVRKTDLRNFPTDEPLFRDPSLPGEGFPFDYLQQTTLKPGEPLFVSHLSKDGDWAFVESPQAAGWIDVRNMAFADADFIAKWMSRPLAVAVREKITLTRSSGTFLFRTGIGGILPMEETSDSLWFLSVLAPFRAPDGRAEFVAVDVSHEKFVPFPLECTPWNMASLMSQMEGEPYGWGGLFGYRDCSGTIRDLFVPFGIWLPRHSLNQAKRGERIGLTGLTGEEKRKRILEEGVPFRTLLWMPGHVMLYLGTFRGEVVVFHTFWGIQTTEGGKEGRWVVGRTAFTSLEPGRELPGADPAGAILNRLESMTLLFEKQAIGG